MPAGVAVASVEQSGVQGCLQLGPTLLPRGVLRLPRPQMDALDIGSALAPIGGTYRVKVLGCLALIDKNETDWKVGCCVGPWGGVVGGTGGERYEPVLAHPLPAPTMLCPTDHHHQRQGCQRVQVEQHHRRAQGARPA